MRAVLVVLGAWLLASVPVSLVVGTVLAAEREKTAAAPARPAVWVRTPRTTPV